MNPLLSQAILFGEFAALRLRRFLADQRGQAMVEYSTITVAILIGGVAAGMGIKWPEFGNQSFVQALYAALQTYVNSINFSLSLAAT